MSRRSSLPLLVWLLAVAAPGAADTVSVPSLGIPPRPARAATGSELAERLASLSPADRSRALAREVVAGNVPSFLRKLHPVKLSPRATIWVMPDYLAVGSDDDFLRVPLGLEEALAVARQFGGTLPTRYMVDRIHAQAERKVEPRPQPPGAWMTSMSCLVQHERAIAALLGGTSRELLVSGVKKDVVMSPRLARHPGKVAIYGWHRAGGRPIQPLSTVHHKEYADYSHGIRLVSENVLVDGQPRSVFELLEDGALCALVSDEGVDGHARDLFAPAAVAESARAAVAAN